MRQYLSLIINGILGVAVIILFALHFSSSKPESVNANKSKGVVSGVTLPIAYIDIDTLLTNYSFAKDASASLVEKTERAQLNFSKKMNQWQKEGAEFQRKLQSNSFLNRERAEQENARLMEKRQDLEELGSKLEQEYLISQKKIDDQLTDTLRIFLKEYNENGKYQLILSNSALYKNVLSADTVYNITSEIIELLNERYIKE